MQPLHRYHLSATMLALLLLSAVQALSDRLPFGLCLWWHRCWITCWPVAAGSLCP